MKCPCALVILLLAATGCEASYTIPPRGDAGETMDDGGVGPDGDTLPQPSDARVGDAALPRPDAMPPDGSPPGSDGSPPGPDGGPRQVLRYVLSEVTLPTSASSYAFDLDGDGRTENQYGAILASLTQNGASVQPTMTASIAAGEDLQLFTFDSSDSALLLDDAPGLRQHVAVTSSGPDFTGSGSFAVNGSKPAAVYQGLLVAGQYLSSAPRTLTTPPTVHLRLAIGDGRTAMLPLHGAHLEARVTPSGLLEGRLHGAWRQADFNATVMPAVAAQIDAIAHQVPCGSTCASVKQLFDSNGDGTITATELTQNPFVRATYTPDLDLFDPSGAWSPNPSRPSPDSLSVAIAFRAVRAQFTAP